MDGETSSTVMRIRMVVEYDGSDFIGYQLQSHGTRTVQGELEAAVGLLNRVPTRVYGSGRTDKGVHATGQVVHCDVHWRYTPIAALKALNAVLPPDIAVRSVEVVDATFDSQRNATSRSYQYVVDNGALRRPLLRHHAWHVPKKLDVTAMSTAANVFIGVQDFRSFGTVLDGKSTLRRLDRLDVTRSEDSVVIDVTANAFLRQMVRALVGTLVEVGLGRIDLADVRKILAVKDKGACPPVAPPQGLYLMHVDYSGVRIDVRNKEMTI